jgi:hypothetical protein
MADEKPVSKIPGWVKAVGTSLLGLASGAALMYLTPLVNNVIKPGKPVPNFAQQTARPAARKAGGTSATAPFWSPLTRTTTSSRTPIRGRAITTSSSACKTCSARRRNGPLP